MKYNLRFLAAFFLPIIRFSSNKGFFIVSALVSFMGCSGANYLRVDAQQPIYFGSPPKGIMMLDSGHIEFIRPLVATTTHISEKEKNTAIKGLNIKSEGVEKNESSIEPEIAKAFEEDPDRFISNVSIDSRVEVYVSWDTVIFYILDLTFSQKTSSDGGGAMSSEAITVTGKVYRQRRDKR